MNKKEPQGKIELHLGGCKQDNHKPEVQNELCLSLATTEWDSISGLMLLKEAPLPQDILKIGAGGVNRI